LPCVDRDWQGVLTAAQGTNTACRHDGGGFAVKWR
jgi:hypothetical protein